MAVAHGVAGITALPPRGADPCQAVIVGGTAACELSTMNETTERFFREISDRVGYNQVAEVYLFPVIRQSGVEAAVAVVAAYPDPLVESHAPRHVVYSANYRSTVKGTDRGKWSVDIVAEADAPLVTVEEVVRGVVRRSGEQFQPEHFTGAEFRAIVPAPEVVQSEPV